MYVVCVREDFPSRRYCNMCDPFLCPVFCDNLPLPLGMIIRKFENAEPRVQFYEPGNYHTVCVGVLWVYRVCVNEVVIETGPFVV